MVHNSVFSRCILYCNQCDETSATQNFKTTKTPLNVIYFIFNKPNRLGLVACFFGGGGGMCLSEAVKKRKGVQGRNGAQVN